MMANYDAHPGGLRLPDEIYCQLLTLQELRGLWILIIGTVSYSYHGLLSISLQSQDVPICEEETVKHYWNT